METTGIWDSRNNRHATVEHETLEPCPFCAGTPRIDDDVNKVCIALRSLAES